MNELLQKHGCSNVFTIPEGLKELMADISREVLRAQPDKIFDFIANYLCVMIITREHGIMAVKILDDLCDCRPSVTEHLEAAGFPPVQASVIAEFIQEEIEKIEPDAGQELVKESQILKRILQRNPIDETMTAKVCQIARNAYRDYWYRKQLLAKSLSKRPEEPWEVAAAHTLEIYKRTNPTFNELNRATEKIQAAYRGYHVRRNLLTVKEKPGPKKRLPGPPIDVAGSREADLGRVISLKVGQDEVSKMFEVDVRNQLGLPFDTTRMLTHIPSQDLSMNECACDPIQFPGGRRTVPRTPFSSGIVDSIHSDKDESVPSLTNMPRISFAREPPEVLGERNKVPDELPALASARDSDGDAEEVPEDITDNATHTDGEESVVSDATTVPDATGTDATDQDAQDGEEE
ncbi:uncharacterized protein LOC125234189 [Leguminivora glycinivorella]|uniref:uncharacterized protein LOC125234189 n=1 Tax=Leguminivora glycinivorella TaxID=1035111 RepID=UPI00200F0389|nr:uncharacterized protein LOC125234189 [Leguminivora glycinivorella]